MYSYPGLTMPTHDNLKPGAIVEHKLRPGVPLEVVSGPKEGLSGEIYRVKMANGKIEPVLKKNLIL